MLAEAWWTRHPVPVDLERPCPNCESVSFENGRCSCCGRPRIQDPEYVDALESRAWDVVNAAYEHFGDELREAAPDGPQVQRAIVGLADLLRHHHYEGDGCIDDDGGANNE